MRSKILIDVQICQRKCKCQFEARMDSERNCFVVVVVVWIFVVVDLQFWHVDVWTIIFSQRREEWEADGEERRENTKKEKKGKAKKQRRKEEKREDEAERESPNK